MKCLIEGNFSTTYYIKFGNYFIRITLEINIYAEIIKQRILFNLNLTRQNYYYFSNLDLEINDFNDVQVEIIQRTTLSPGDNVFIYPNTIAIVHTSGTIELNCIKLGKINESIMINKL